VLPAIEILGGCGGGGALGAEPKGGRVPSPHCGCFGRSKISFFYAQKKVFFVIFFQKNARNPAKK
jgi:hypothetical protein